jgi:hypothetical protein
LYLRRHQGEEVVIGVICALIFPGFVYYWKDDAMCRVLQRLGRSAQESAILCYKQVDLSSTVAKLNAGSNNTTTGEVPELVVDLQHKSWIIQSSVEQKASQSPLQLARSRVKVENGTLSLPDGCIVAVDAHDVTFENVHIMGRGARKQAEVC